MNVVVSQPMFLPWLGLFEQIKLARVYVHYDDVQLPQGRSFMSRVQVKGANGVFWLTAPVDRAHSGPLISETCYREAQDWRAEHLLSLSHCYARCPHYRDMFALAECIYGFEANNMAAFNRHAIEKLAGYLGLAVEFRLSSEMGIGGASTGRLVALCERLGATSYITGHGALQYLDHEAFEARGIKVEYMSYLKIPYAQPYGAFTPFVTCLDAIANCGKDAAALLQSRSTYWKDFMNGPH